MRFSTIVVVGKSLPRKKQERGRRKCLELLLVELEKNGVDMLILEARDSEKDKKDIALLLAMRQKGLATKIDIAHKRADSNPRLWISDQILGAYGDELCSSKGIEKWDAAWKKLTTRLMILNTTI